jgi:hypothetical protein
MPSPQLFDLIHSKAINDIAKAKNVISFFPFLKTMLMTAILQNI